jgi:transcriptional regulator with PAS, ATPase and Fis domain
MAIGPSVVPLTRTPASPVAHGGETGLAAIVGNSGAIEGIRSQIVRVARAACGVLITGETGTGKELAAAAIHECGLRADRPFISINCAALPEALLESELFGHTRGAFTGAHQSRDGLLAACDGGTVFLDEVGDLCLAGQAKLLRALEAKQVRRIGSNLTLPVDFRVVAATNRDLEKLVETGEFRKDLYYRLNVARVHLPPLRERLDDVPVLVNHYVRILNREFSIQVEEIEPGVLECLARHDWPGNIRELRNTLEVSYLNCRPPVLALADLPRQLREACAPVSGRVSESEQTVMLSVLNEVNWNKSEAARKLHWSRLTLYRKLKRYGLVEPVSGEPA